MINISAVEVTMSSVQSLRELINERLTAATEEILTVFEGTIVQYEEEIDRQRRLLEILLKPEIKLHRIGLPQQHGCKEEEVFTDQQLSNQERNSSLDQEEPEPPQIEDEQCNSREGEQLVVKQEIDDFMVTCTYEESHCSDQLPFHCFPVAENRVHTGSQHVDSGSSRNAELKPKRKHHKKTSPCNKVDNSPLSETQCDTDTDLPKQHDCKEEVLTDQQLSNQQRNPSLDQEKPEPPQIKEEQDELCTSKEGEQLVLEQEIDAFMVTPTYEGRDLSYSEPNSDQLPSHSFPVGDSGEKSFRCDVCGKAFKYKSNMTKHYRVHTGEKPYSCKFCGKQFSQHSSVMYHIKSHTGERPFPCKTCGRSFKRKDCLTLHMRTHTGEGLIFCKTCGKGFVSNHQLTVHMRTHTGEKPYSCKTCGKTFSQIGSLSSHMRTHTGEKPYLCKICGQTFSRRDRLLNHVRSHS